MRCASCGFENEVGAQFCEECGTPLVRTCPSCGREVRPTAKFCSQCGTRLTSQASPPAFPQPGQPPAHPAVPAPQLTARGTSEAERRQLTVMFCDLVGSTALSEQLDPEELREVVQAYQATCTSLIRRYDGHVAQHLGDGLLVYFGYPQAHEDDAQRAVRAGLEILAGLSPLNAQLSPTIRARLPHPVQVRIGVHTGLVVVGEIGSTDKREVLALGETPNIAARVQSLAEPDTVVLSAATQGLVTGLFECQELGPQTLKGISTPQSVYRVVHESAARSRFEVAVRTGLTPLVGREEELGLLRRHWEQAQAGEGHVVLLSGEPGIGKSRLMQTLKEQASAEGATCIEFRCSPYHQNSAFYPILDHLQRLLQFAPHEPYQAKLTKLQQALAAYRFPQVDTLPLLAALLSLPHPESTPLLTLSPQKQKQKTQEALVAWVIEETEKAAVYCAWEDLHWADPSTLEVLTLFLNQVPTTRLLALLTFRPEFIPAWGLRSYLTQLTLNRLGRQQVETMVEKVTHGKALPAEVLQQIVVKTDGVPLFVEELTKMVMESIGSVGLHGRAPVTLGIPSTLQDALMARLDRLAPVRELAQVGAMLGREFSYELIHVVSPVDEATLRQGLRQLVEAELLYQRGLPPQATYLFKHALIQDTAYQSLLKSTRQQYHQQIAQVLADRFPETVETQPELLAHHYTEAGLKEQAIPHWQRAGGRATQRSAYAEAISHLTKGLELLKTLPGTPERAQQELMLQVALGSPLQATAGFGAPKVEGVYARARELCLQVGETPQLHPVLSGLLIFYLVRGKLQTARELGEQCLSLAQRLHDPASLLRSHCLLGMTLFYCGEFVPGREHLEQGVAHYDLQQYRSLAPLSGRPDSGVVCLCYAAWVLGMLGYSDQAMTRSHEALTLAQELAHPLSLSLALGFAALLHQLRREEQAAQERAATLMTLSAEQGFASVSARATIVRGWALVEQGQGTEGIAQMCQGVAALRATRQEDELPYWLALLAEAYGKVGRAEEGLSTLAEALAVADKTGVRFYEAELYRLKGELTLQSNMPSRESRMRGAEACFLKAINIAHHQSAKSWELRAVMSLVRLWQQQGKREEAHKMLAEIYGWFTEGFDTKDLQEAKALLEELT
jgi:class 3 adenylate cyclase/predicted ATPase